MTPDLTPYASTLELIASRFARNNGRLPLMEVDDFLQVARIAAWKALATHDPVSGSQLSSWVYSKATYACIDHVRALRGERRRLHRSLPRGPSVSSLDAPLSGPAMRRPESVDNPTLLDVVSAETVYGDDLAAVDNAIDSSQDLRVWRAVAALDERRRTVLIEIVVRGRTLPEVARILGVSQGRVSQMKREAIAAMAAILAPPPA